MTQRLPQRTMDSTRPRPGMVSPRAAIRIPSGPSRTAVPSRTSTTVQPGIVAGLVSGAATRGCRIAIAGPAFAWEAGLVAGRALPANRADGLGMLPTMAGKSGCGCRLSSAFDPAARSRFGNSRRGRFFLRNFHKTELACELRPVQAAGPSQSKACHHRCSDQHSGACPIAKWLPHHQYRVAIGLEEIPQARALLPPLAGNHIPRPDALKGTRLAVLHGVTQFSDTR